VECVDFAAAAAASVLVLVAYLATFLRVKEKFLMTFIRARSPALALLVIELNSVAPKQSRSASACSRAKLDPSFAELAQFT
jgi:hypothetical protein